MRAASSLPVPTSGERFALGGVALVLALQACGLGPALEYRRDLLLQQPWRLLTCHLVHVNWRHALLDALAWLAVAWLFSPELTARRQALALALTAGAVSATLAAAYPEIDWYRGLSGALHGLFLAGATMMCGETLAARAPQRARDLALSAALFAGAWTKVALELNRGELLPADWLDLDVVAPAHLAGAAAGTAFGLAAGLVAHLRRQQMRKRSAPT